MIATGGVWRHASADGRRAHDGLKKLLGAKKILARILGLTT
jgi:hypothetical protein